MPVTCFRFADRLIGKKGLLEYNVSNMFAFHIVHREAVGIVRLLAATILLLLVVSPLGFAQQVDFEREIAPILKSRCVGCHGPKKQESGFRLDRRTSLLRGGDYGEPAIVPGDPAKGTLLAAIKATDPDFRMPPEGALLSKQQVMLIERWIKAGAVWPGQMGKDVPRERSTHWAFQPVVRPAVPGGKNLQGQEIDSFVRASLAQAGISMSPEADARTLIRRVSVVLTGLPPTPEEVRAFETRFAKDPEQAYIRLVEQQLGSKHFGERWAQHWLDGLATLWGALGPALVGRDSLGRNQWLRK